MTKRQWTMADRQASDGVRLIRYLDAAGAASRQEAAYCVVITIRATPLLTQAAQ
jgi:hypothetical protein